MMLKENIKEFRTEKGLTQAQLAEKIGVTQGAIYFWEKGINEPTAGYLMKLAKLFSVSVDDLLSFDCNKKQAPVLSKSGEITRLFEKMTEKQQELIIDIAKEIVKKK